MAGEHSPEEVIHTRKQIPHRDCVVLWRPVTRWHKNNEPTEMLTCKAMCLMFSRSGITFVLSFKADICEIRRCIQF